MSGKQKTISIKPDPAATAAIRESQQAVEESVANTRKPPQFEKGTFVVVLQWSENDAVAAIRLLEWIGDLRKGRICDVGAEDPPRIAHCCPRRTPGYLVEKVEALIKAAGIPWGRIDVPFDLPDESYPRGSVWGLWSIARWASLTKSDFLLMEPDMVPLNPQWWIRIQDEYFECPFPYLGAIEPAHPAGHYPRHMAGCGVYHHGLWNHINTDRLDLAWDVAIAEHVVPLAQRSKVIQQVFGTGAGPRFRSVWDVQRIVNEEASLFHRNKDGSLIQILRSRLAMPVQGATQMKSVEFMESVSSGQMIGRSTPDRPTIYTYFEELPNGLDDPTRLMLAVWIESWHRAGWNPVVLGREHATAHPWSDHLDKDWLALRKTKNAWEYERACYRRWLAYHRVAFVNGATDCYFADWDVMNEDLTPQRAKAEMPRCDLVLGSTDGVCCFGRVTPYGLENMFAAFSRPFVGTGTLCAADNISDMNIIRDFVPYLRANLVRLFGNPDTSIPLIHFSNHALPAPEDRLKAVRGWAEKVGIQC